MNKRQLLDVVFIGFGLLSAVQCIEALNSVMWQLFMFSFAARY